MFFVYLLVLLIVISYFYIINKFSYWQRRDYPYDHDTSIPFGCLKSVSRHEKSMGMAIYDVYRKSNERFLGVYLLFRPGVLIRNVELVRHVLAQDFSSFHDRGVYVDEEKNPLSANLFSLRGKSWRNMRLKLAPLFTSGKLKAMFSTSEEVGDKMVAHLDTLIMDSRSVEIDIKDILTTYAIDIIASVIFGLEINSFDNPSNKFRDLVRVTRKNTFFSAIFGMVIFLCPSVASLLFHITGFRNPVGTAMRDIVKETIEYREKHNIMRKDMLQLLMQLRNTGKIDDEDSNWNTQGSDETDDVIKPMSIETIAAQLFIFYIAGQETTASTAAFTIFELAQYPDLLEKVKKEVNDVLSINGGKITYEILQNMTFLDLCITETLRKYPGLPLLNRECTQEYKIPGTDKIIEKGTPIVISLFGIHRDPENFPNPNKYDPERFLETNRNYNPNAYMPFGEGPRHCIAQRMGKMNSKLAVVKILQHFNVEYMEKQEIEIDNHSIGIIPKGGVKVRISKIKSN